MKSPARTLCLAIALYLAGDIFLFHGPVHRRLLLNRTPGDTVVARVSGHSITVSQLDRALQEMLWLDGRSSVPPADLRSARDAALQELIDLELLRLQSEATTTPLPVSEMEIDDQLRRFARRFEDEAARRTAMKSQGIANDREFRDRMAARIRQQKYIDLHIGPAIKVGVDEARKWFDANPQSTPERLQVRHIFLPTLDYPPADAKRRLDEALIALTTRQKDFATLARDVSEDPATKDNGGELGWMTRDRLPADFADPVFSLGTNKPALVRTKLGWHLVEVTARKPAEPRTFEQAKPEIIAALEAIKRREAVEAFRKSLREPPAAKVEIFPANPAS